MDASLTILDSERVCPFVWAVSYKKFQQDLQTAENKLRERGVEGELSVSFYRQGGLTLAGSRPMSPDEAVYYSKKG